MKRAAQKRQPAPEIDPEQVRVQLRPILGIRPAVYLTALYALAAIVLLFFVLLYPGLRSRGTYVTFATRPVGAAVYVDGVYRGATPVEILVPMGQRVVTLSRPGLLPVTVRMSVPGRIFATLFFKPRELVTQDLSVEDPAALAMELLRVYATYAHEKDNGLLTETARVLTSPAIRVHPGAARALEQYLQASMAFVAPPAGDLADYIGAWAVKASDGGVLGPGALVDLVRSLASFASRKDLWPAWVLLNAPQELAQHSIQQTWFVRSLERAGTRAGAAVDGRTAAGAPVVVSGVTLRPIPGGTALIGDRGDAGGLGGGPQPAHAVVLEPFYMAQTETTNRQYGAFLADTPEWRPSRRSALVEQGAVTERYLETWAEDRPPAGAEDLPVTHVSYHAAQAYAQWLNRRLPSTLAGYRMRLPHEAEWEWAARAGGVASANPPFQGVAIDGPVRAGSTPANGFGLTEMQGNVWEWCEGWYAPAAYFLSTAQGEGPDTSGVIPVGTERVVRGGSWANEARLVPLHARGSQDPAWATPYLGFRVVLAFDTDPR